MKKIPLTRGKVAIIDDADYPLIAGYRWYCNDEGYAVSNNKGNSLRMHRLILGTPPDKITDHINKNGLDNRRSNLRLADKSTNGCNRPKQANNKSGVKGVCFDKRFGYWRAYVTLNRKQVFNSYYKKFEDAVAARRAAALKYHKEFAYEAS